MRQIEVKRFCEKLSMCGDLMNLDGVGGCVESSR